MNATQAERQRRLECASALSSQLPSTPRASTARAPKSCRARAREVARRWRGGGGVGEGWPCSLLLLLPPCSLTPVAAPAHCTPAPPPTHSGRCCFCPSSLARARSLSPRCQRLLPSSQLTPPTTTTTPPPLLPHHPYLALLSGFFFFLQEPAPRSHRVEGS